MWKSLTGLFFSGLAVILTVIAATNIGTTSLFMMYQPELPGERNR